MVGENNIMTMQTKQKSKNVKEKDEAIDSYDSRVVSIKRTTKVREGGRDFSFSAVAVVGDRKGQVGLGCGKGKEVTLAVQKATNNARKNMRHITLKKDTIQYQIISQCGATKVIMLPGVEGTGIIAGGAMRPVFEVLGVKNVIAKSMGARNPLNVARATINGLVNISSPSKIAKKRGKTIAEILDKKIDKKIQTAESSHVDSPVEVKD